MKDSQDSADTKSSTKAANDPHGDQQNPPPETPAGDSGSVSVTCDKNRKITREDIEVVQNLIERCLQLYMSKDEVIYTLVNRARIEPGFTTLVWQKLEEENSEFFKAYNVRLKLKKQIIAFNQLLEQQYHVMKYPAPPKVPLAPAQNGIHHVPVNSLPMGYPVLQQPPVPSLGHPPIDPMGNMSSCHVVSGIPAPANFHPMQISPTNGSAAGNETVIPMNNVKSEMVVSPTAVGSNGQFSFPSSDMSGMNVDASAVDSTFTSEIACSEGLTLGPDGETGDSKESFGSLAHIPWHFSVSDLMADLTHMEDPGAISNYTLPSDSDILLDSPDHNDIVEDFFVDAVPGPSSHSDEEKP